MTLKAAGIALDNMAVFSDCGKEMNVQRCLSNAGAFWLHFKN
jgi:hypothetical protein